MLYCEALIAQGISVEQHNFLMSTLRVSCSCLTHTQKSIIPAPSHLQSKGWIVALRHIQKWGEGAERAAFEGIFTKIVGAQREATATTLMYKHLGHD